ncbi:MAG: radical SAM family heme chaperone HemW [Desulfomonilaceae bacterium]|nr:radical SAM family heme chaperone HemW [Desulfomonilaceae bacterium]
MFLDSPIFPSDDGPAGIYIHLPFCRGRCTYCGFVTTPHDPLREEHYVRSVVNEMEMRSRSGDDLRASAGAADTVYLGGGTPSLLRPDLISRIIDGCTTNFRVLPQPEITIEINPGTASPAAMRDLLRSGINRASLGIQSLHDRELQRMGRPHTSGEALAAFQDLRDAGFDNISVDLIAGFPDQTRDTVRATVEQTLALEPDHLSVYLLEVKEGTKLASQLRDRGLTLDDDTAADMYEDICTLTSSAGFVHYEISNFARSGKRSAHNLKYWTDKVYIGVGAGAHGMTGRLRYANLSELDLYEKAVRNGILPVSNVTPMTPLERFKDALIMGLRLVEGIDMQAYGKRYGIDCPRFVHETVRDLEEAGLIHRSGSNLRLAPRGRLLSNLVFSRWV